MRVDFQREREWWDAKAPYEERDKIDEAVNRSLRWREIEKHLKGIRTILEVGGGTGTFSIPLAHRGFMVTHIDLSPAMLSIARSKAQDLQNIHFVEGNAVDLSEYGDSSFDMVLNMDGAISFCGPEAEFAISESCRVSGKKLIISVSHRVCMIPVWLSARLKDLGRIVPAVHEMMDHGEWYQEQFPENPELAKGMTQDYMGPFKAFLPGELSDLLLRCGMRVLRIGGIGSLANFVGQETVERAAKDEHLFQEFLDLCERFDAEILPDGPGTRNRAGLIAVAEPCRE